jgi:hypothetical protein
MAIVMKTAMSFLVFLMVKSSLLELKAGLLAFQNRITPAFVSDNPALFTKDG